MRRGAWIQVTENPVPSCCVAHALILPPKPQAAVLNWTAGSTQLRALAGRLNCMQERANGCIREEQPRQGRCRGPGGRRRQFAASESERASLHHARLAEGAGEGCGCRRVGAACIRRCRALHPILLGAGAVCRGCHASAADATQSQAGPGGGASPGRPSNHDYAPALTQQPPAPTCTSPKVRTKEAPSFLRRRPPSSAPRPSAPAPAACTHAAVGPKRSGSWVGGAGGPARGQALGSSPAQPPGQMVRERCRHIHSHAPAAGAAAAAPAPWRRCRRRAPPALAPAGQQSASAARPGKTRRSRPRARAPAGACRAACTRQADG